jgi:hypothetical protein
VLEGRAFNQRDVGKGKVALRPPLEQQPLASCLSIEPLLSLMPRVSKSHVVAPMHGDREVARSSSARREPAAT